VFFMMMITIDVSRETFFSSRNWANLEEYHIDKEREKRIGGNKTWVQGTFVQQLWNEIDAAQDHMSLVRELQAITFYLVVLVAFVKRVEIAFCVVLELAYL